MNENKPTKSKEYGKANILASFHKIVIVVVSASGETVAWGASAADGIRETAKIVAAKAVDTGMHSVDVTIKGSGKGRESAILGLLDAGLEIRFICDKTPIPHKGVRRQRVNMPTQQSST